MSGRHGITHGGKYVMFRGGNTASDGVILLAEGGRDMILQAEWVGAKCDNRVGTPFEAPDAATLPGTVSVEFGVSSELPLVSFASVIDPSPVRIAGMADLSVRDGEAWRGAVTVPLWASDAGSDTGTSDKAENAETQLQRSPRLLTVALFFSDAGFSPVGQAVVTRLK